MLAEIRDRLESQLLGLGQWHGVEFAEDIDAMSDAAARADTCTAIVAPWRERAGDQTLASGGHRQLVKEQFLVGIVVREYDGDLPAARASRFDTLKSDVETALAGWEPGAAFDPCQLVDGESSPVTTGVSIYVQTWQTSRLLTGA